MVVNMSALKITTLTEKNTCNLCNNDLAKYSCPRCNLLYCSLKCYQSEAHLECSESFYKELVKEHLTSASDSAEDGQKKMEEILKQYHEQNLMDGESEDELDSDDEPDNVTDLGDRLAGINLDDCEEVWKHLTEEERRDFETFMKSGDIAQYITMWTPWWEFCIKSKVLDVEALNKHKDSCPKLDTHIKKFTEISSRSPASCVHNNLINVLAAYAFLVRYFNGEHREFPKEFCMLLHTISLNIKENVNYDTLQLAVESVKAQSQQCQDLGITTDKENLDHIREDINAILAGPHSSESKFYILAALSDIKSMITQSKSEKIEENAQVGEFYEKFTATMKQSLEGLNKESLKTLKRKVDYYLSFTNDFL